MLRWLGCRSRPGRSLGFHWQRWSVVAFGACLGVAGPAAAASAAPGAAAGWQVVSYGRVTLQVPAAWPVVDLATDPSACIRLDVHAVYLGTPGRAASCPASGLGGKTEGVQIAPVQAGSPQVLAATRPTVIGGVAAKTNPDAALTHTITDVIGGTLVSLSYGTDAALMDKLQSTITVPGPVPPLASLPRALITAGQVQGVASGGGFDACSAPSSGAMSAWLASSYRSVGVYIGGADEACAQPSLTASWVNTVEAQGWHIFPLYPGLQAPCVDASGDSTFSASNAAAEGAASADDAVTQAQNLGFPAGTPLIYDMEAYSGCGSAVITFLNAWDTELAAKGYGSGVYESFSNVSDLVNANGSINEPQLVDYAAWDGQATTSSSYMPSNMWTSHQRIHQYAGGHNETWGGQTIDIDSDQLDANLGGPVGHSAFHVAVGLNSSGPAEMFARAANGTLVHDYQDPSGNEGWSGWYGLGNSPSGIASNPAVAANADGHLEVFARASNGQVVHAWQDPGGPDGWLWGGAVPAGGSAGATKGDPHAVLRPGGTVAVFVADASGAVQTTAQASADGAAGWSAWSDMGGSCAGSPIPFVDAAGTVEVFCRTTGGTLAVDVWNGSGWNGWATAGSSPSGLTADPAAVSNADGHTEVFIPTSGGGLDHVWQNQASGAWTWGSALVGSGVANAPAVIRWPAGRVEVFFQRSDGRLGHVYQNSANGATGWTVGGALGGSVVGSPQAWVNTGGTPEIAALDDSLQIAHTYWTGSGWINWVQLGGSF